MQAKSVRTQVVGLNWGYGIEPSHFIIKNSNSPGLMQKLKWNRKAGLFQLIR